MDPDELLAELNKLTRLPTKDWPHDGKLIAHKFNQLCDWMSMGGRPPENWVPSVTKPYCREWFPAVAGAWAAGKSPLMAKLAETSPPVAEPRLMLPAMVDCEECGTTFAELWEAPEGTDTVEDLVEPPRMDSVCPSCGKLHKDLEWPGWMFRTEAG